MTIRSRGTPPARQCARSSPSNIRIARKRANCSTVVTIASGVSLSNPTTGSALTLARSAAIRRWKWPRRARPGIAQSDRHREAAASKPTPSIIAREPVAARLRRRSARARDFRRHPQRERSGAAARRATSIFVPNRSFEVYLHQRYSYDEIEAGMRVPFFGNRRLLRAEERDEDEQSIRVHATRRNSPSRRFESPDEIDRLVMVKAPHAQVSFERAFFLASSPEEYTRTAAHDRSRRILTASGLATARSSRSTPSDRR